MSDVDCQESFELKSSLSDGQQNECRFIICTVAFGCGFDIDSATLAAHVRTSYSNLSFVQESEKRGRNGDVPATSIIITGKVKCLQNEVTFKNARLPTHCSSSTRSLHSSFKHDTGFNFK